MVVVTLSNCPSKLRGDLSKWMFEISTGVYVGSMSSRVRDLLWARICGNLKNGRAVMVFSAANEQGLDFRVHNTSWEPVDFDGIKIMRRPSEKETSPQREETFHRGYSRAAKMRMAGSIHKEAAGDESFTALAVVCLDKEGCMDLGAAKASNGQISGIRTLRIAPEDTCDRFPRIEEKKMAEAKAFLEFIGDNPLIAFEPKEVFSCIRLLCRRYGLALPANKCSDISALAERKLDDIINSNAESLVSYFSLGAIERNRVGSYCEAAIQVYLKLKEMS